MDARIPTGVLRLSGLPNVARYPEATVERDEASIIIRFSGRLYGEQTMSVPLKYVGAEDDEMAELELLAQLQRIGYRVRRASPGVERALRIEQRGARPHRFVTRIPVRGLSGRTAPAPAPTHRDGLCTGRPSLDARLLAFGVALVQAQEVRSIAPREKRGRKIRPSSNRTFRVYALM
jgi:hypothetical protein